MKSLKLLLVAGSMLALSIAPSLHAQEGKMKGGDRMKMMADALDLTDAQKAKIKPIMASEAADMKALKDDTTTADDAKRGKMQEIRKSHQAQIRAVLTPDQQAKFDAMGQGGQGGKGGKGKKGKGKKEE